MLLNAGEMTLKEMHPAVVSQALLASSAQPSTVWLPQCNDRVSL